MKRLLPFLCMTILFCVNNVDCYAHDFEVDGIYYNKILQLQEAIVTYYGTDYNSAQYSGTVIIPDSVSVDGEKYSVKRIGDYAFYNCTGITEISIPNSITTISNSAFEGCAGKLVINCNINSSQTYYSVGGSFYRSKFNSIEFKEGVTKIGDGAFFECTDLTNIVFSDSLKYIGRQTFEGCSKLTSLTIPSNVTEIGRLAFYRCTGLTNISVSPNNKMYGSRGNCNAIIDEGLIRNRLILGCKNSFIPQSVTSIADAAFYECEDLTTLDLPDNLYYIGSEAFYGCKGLTTLNIPDSLESIGDKAFYGCTGLTSITIPQNVRTIGDMAFAECTNTTEVCFPQGNSWKYLGPAAFSGCKGRLFFNRKNIPGADTFENSGFYGSEFNQLEIGDNVTNIGKYAFNNCKFRDIQIFAEIPPTIRETSFSGPSLYHTVLLVPHGCFDNYAYDDTYWYQFIHIKENAGTKQNLSPKQAYELKNAGTRSYIIYDAVNDAVRNLDLDANIDEDNANHNWQVVEANGNTYIYNIGAKKYLYAEGLDSKLKLSSTPVAIPMSDGEKGIKLGDAGEWLFILNDQLAVDESVSDIEQLAIESKLDAYTPTYSLHGTKVQATQQKGLFVRNGKKMLIK